MHAPAAFAAAFASVLLTVAYAQPQPRTIPLGDDARLSVLTSRVLRLEIGAPEDAATITFPHRASQPVPDYKLDRIEQAGLTLTTADVELRLALPVSAGDLGCDRLNVTLLTGALRGDVVCPGTAATRVPTDSQHPGVVMDSWTDIAYDTAGNLNGSVDTTDCYVDADACYEVFQSRMQPGLLSRRGYAVVDDSNTSLWDNSSEWMWRRDRPTRGKDLYLFLHGHDYRGALQVMGPSIASCALCREDQIHSATVLLHCVGLREPGRQDTSETLARAWRVVVTRIPI